MFKFLSKIFLDERARKTLDANRARKKLSEREQHIAQLQNLGKDLVTPERQELLQQAMRMRQAKAKVLDDLNDEQKAKLYALALKAMLNEDADGGKT